MTNETINTNENTKHDEMNVMAWDDVIADTKNNMLTTPGRYRFDVISAQKDFCENGCPMVRLTMSIDTPDGKIEAKNILFLRADRKWLLASFFRCLGMLAAGGSIRMDWDHVIGKQGWADFRPDTYTGTDNRQHYCTRVERYIPPEEVNQKID